MRILAINHEFPPLGGGGANANYYIARELVRLGDDVTVITSHFRGLPLAENVDGIRVIRLGCLRHNENHSTMLESASFVARAIPFAVGWARRNRPDIVQAFFALPSGPVAWAASRAAKCPFVIRLGGGDVPGSDPTRYARAHRLLMPITRRVMRAAAALVVNSEGLRAKAQEAYPDLKFTTIPNGVDLEEFRPADDGEHEGPLRLLFVSRLIERKGLQYLIPALGQLRREGYDFRLRIVGDGPMRARVETLVAKAGIVDRVRMDGNIAHKDLPEVYQDADVFVLPSLSEGMPNVVLEAGASGLSMIATDVPGSHELVVEGDNGRLVRVGDVTGIARAVKQDIEERDMLSVRGRRSRERIRSLSWEALAKSYHRVYCRAVANHDRPGEWDLQDRRRR